MCLSPVISKLTGSYRYPLSRGNWTVLRDQRVPAAKVSGKGAWLVGKGFGGDFVRVL